MLTKQKEATGMGAFPGCFYFNSVSGDRGCRFQSSSHSRHERENHSAHQKVLTAVNQFLTGLDLTKCEGAKISVNDDMLWHDSPSTASCIVVE